MFTRYKQFENYNYIHFTLNTIWKTPIQNNQTPIRTAFHPFQTTFIKSAPYSQCRSNTFLGLGQGFCGGLYIRKNLIKKNKILTYIKISGVTPSRSSCYATAYSTHLIFIIIIGFRAIYY